MKRVVVFDFGQGNLYSVEKALAYWNADPARVGDDAALGAPPEAFVLPGVGAFGAAMKGLRERDLVEPVARAARAAAEGEGPPFLGICLGMQLLFESSEESPGVEGLGVLGGRVVRLPREAGPVPQIGWNEVVVENGASAPGLSAFAPRAWAYFNHAYRVEPKDGDIVAATTKYGDVFPSVVARGRLVATQFHPEKSSKRGLAFLRAFLS